MGYHPRIEAPDKASFQTTRSQNSRLWFVNNPNFEKAVLGYAAKYADRYGAKIYALAIEGNHIQFPAHFPNENRSAFMRDFNSSVARALPRYVAQFEGGRLWGRRYSNEFLPGNADIEEYFFYTVLQPVQDGLVSKISEYPEYPGYNCFSDAIWGRVRTFKVVNWGDYNSVRRYNSNASVHHFTYEVKFRYARIPGYESLSQKDYAHLMQRKLEERRVKIVADRKARGLGFVGREALEAVVPGAWPRSTKSSSKTTHRPRVLSICHQRRAQCKTWYFNMYLRPRQKSNAPERILIPSRTAPMHHATDATANDVEETLTPFQHYQRRPAPSKLPLPYFHTCGTSAAQQLPRMFPHDCICSQSDSLFRALGVSQFLTGL